MSWWPLLALCAAAYALKLAGALAGGRLRGDHGSGAALGRLALPVFAAIIVTQTVGSGRHLVLDARLPAVCVAGVLVWRRAPFVVVAVGAAATAALVRLAT